MLINNVTILTHWAVDGVLLNVPTNINPLTHTLNIKNKIVKVIPIVEVAIMNTYSVGFLFWIFARIFLKSHK